jgi:hypothetical protein
MKLILFTLFAVSILIAADPTGVWKAEYTIPDGSTRTTTFHLKADGEKLTGKLVTAVGEAPIQNGVVKGDDISFSAVRNFNGNDFTIKYTGTLSGDEIKMKAIFSADRSIDMVAKKQN